MLSIDLITIKEVLTRLIELFYAESSLLRDNIKTNNIMIYNQEKIDLLNYLEWNNGAIVQMMQNQNLDTSKEMQDDYLVKKEIIDLIKVVHIAAEENMKLIEQKKYLNDQFIEFLQGAVKNTGQDTERYGPKAKTNSTNVYGKKTPHIIYDENI